MRVNEIKETKEVVVKTEYIAKDGKVFSDREECEKYEKSYKCVIMMDYKRLVKGRISEDCLYNGCGDCDYYYDIVEVKNEQDREIVNKALMSTYGNANFIEDYGTYLIGIDYDGEIGGYYTTIEEVIKNIRKAYDEVLNGGRENEKVKH